MQDLHERARRGLRLLLLRQAVLQLFNLAGGIVVARRLGPQGLGVFGIATFFVTVASVVTELGIKTALVRRAMISARLLFPEPGGPWKIQEGIWSRSMAVRSEDPGASSRACPTISSSVRGRIRAAKGTRGAFWAPCANRSIGPRTADLGLQTSGLAPKATADSRVAGRWRWSEV